MKAVHEDHIRRRAHQIWEERGRPHGLEREHWAEAEKELLDAAQAMESSAKAVRSVEAVAPEKATPPRKPIAAKPAKAPSRPDAPRVR